MWRRSNRYDFDVNTRGGFKYHVSQQHNPLSYVFYLLALRASDETDYSGCDSAVVAALRDGVTSEERAGWLPVNRALALRQVEAEEEGREEQQAKLLADMMRRQRAIEAELRALPATIMRSIAAAQQQQQAPAAAAAGAAPAGA